MSNSDKLFVRSVDKFLNYLIAVVVILIAVSFFLFKSPPEKTAKKQKLSDSEVNKIVNKHLQQAVDQNRIIQMKTEAALREARRKVEKEILESRRKQDEANSNIPRDRQIWTEAEMAEKIRQAEQQNSTTNSGRSPDGAGLQSPRKSAPAAEEDFDVRSMTPAEKKEYAKQYIENARKGGVDIELDENLEVTKSTPIRKPSKQDDSFDSLPTD